MYLLFQSKFCNLGYSLTAVDVNKDGHLDLVMGTPHYSQGNLTQNGMVAILQSKAMSKWSKYDTPPPPKNIYKKVFLLNKSFIRLTWLYEVCVVVLLHVITADFSWPGSGTTIPVESLTRKIYGDQVSGHNVKSSTKLSLHVSQRLDC